jgi:hypothetical protein
MAMFAGYILLSDYIIP